MAIAQNPKLQNIEKAPIALLKQGGKPMAVSTIPTDTTEEYLEREKNAEIRSEFIDGTIIEMAGATASHNRLTGKFHARLLLALDDTEYSVFMSDMRIWLPKDRSILILT